MPTILAGNRESLIPKYEGRYEGTKRLSGYGEVNNLVDFGRHILEVGWWYRDINV